MSTSYVAVSWNKFKKTYDTILWLSIALYLIVFYLLNIILFPQLLPVTIIIRACGTLAIILLHVILIIGPLCRIQPGFLPLLYNRRHLGVTMFFIASIHAVLSLLWFHSSGILHPLISLFAGNTHYSSLRFFPFQTLGFGAYIILMIMAFTSHDFWLNLLSPRVWKGIHMLVYLAYSLLIMHVVLGVIQLENSPLIFLMLLAGLIIVASLHIWAGFKEWQFDTKTNTFDTDDWVYVCDIADIPENRAKMAVINKERVAVFKYGNKLSAVHNVCKHQNGPLGEGKVVDGCITCPWHGYQYLPHNGCAPAPFTEQLATYHLKLVGQAIYINPTAQPEGTAIDPIIINEDKPISSANFFIGWGAENPASLLKLNKNIALGFLGVALLIASGFIVNQKHIANGTFDYDNLKTVEGQLIRYPFPAIRVLVGNDKTGRPLVNTYPLVNDSKFGADGLVDSVRKVYNTDRFITQIKGAIIKRDGTTAMELSNGFQSIKILSKPNHLPMAKLEAVADTTMLGEIIDPKCYLGAMNPGEGKPHRACAILCIRGGIMPMLTFKGKARQQQYAVLQGEKGEAINEQITKYVAEPVSMSGKLFKFDNWYVFYANPNTGIKPLFK